MINRLLFSVIRSALFRCNSNLLTQIAPDGIVWRRDATAPSDFLNGSRTNSQLDEVGKVESEVLSALAQISGKSLPFVKYV
jgi:hypothetical protein